MTARRGVFARPLPGDGLVAQEAELSLVSAAPDAGPDAGPAALVDGLLAAVADVAAEGGDGADLVRRAERVLAARHGGHRHACAVAGPTGNGGLAVLVGGGAAARVTLADGAEIRMRGGPQGPAVRTIEGPVAALELALGPAGRAESRLGLSSGVVRGGGLRRTVRRAPVPGPVPGSAAAGASYPAGAPVRPVSGPPAGPVPAAGPERAPRERPPEDRVDLVRREPKSGIRSGPQVLGANCKNEHFNDPRAHYCAICGISMLQLTLTLFRGPRPPLGVLLLDDGDTVPLDHDRLVGRQPGQAPEVTEGGARPLRLADPDDSVSRRHALIRLEEWNVRVVDLGSANGTFLREPGEEEFRPLPRDTPVDLRPGAAVRVGLTRTLRFESNRKV